MLFQIYGENAGFQLLGWALVFVGLIAANELARRSKKGGIFFFLALPAALTVYFIAIYAGAAMGAEWALNNPTYTHMNSWFHYAKLYAATIGCIGFFLWSRVFSVVPSDPTTITPASYMYDQIFGTSISSNAVASGTNVGMGAAIGVVLCLITVAAMALINLIFPKEKYEM